MFISFCKMFLGARHHLGVTLISWATAIRWVGWGFVDYLVPIFLFSLVGTYTGTGLLQSSYNLVFLLVLPIVGVIADKVKAKYIIIVGLLIYPFISLSYFLAGALGLVFFVVIARGLNGISYALDSTGRDVYFRRHAPRGRVGSAFGFFRTLTGFWVLLSVLSSLVLVNYFQIHTLFLFIIPTTLIALLIILKIPADSLDNKTKGNWRKCLSWRSYLDVVHEVILWKKNLKFLAVVSFLSGIILAISSFFIPVFLYNEGFSLEKVILFMAVYSIPNLFGAPLGSFIDRIGKKAISPVFILSIIFLLAVGFSSTYSLRLFFMFLLSLTNLFLAISISSESTRVGNPRRYGTISSAFGEIQQFSAIIGPFFVGFLIDILNLPLALLLVSVIFLCIFFLALFLKKNHN